MGIFVSKKKIEEPAQPEDPEPSAPEEPAPSAPEPQETVNPDVEYVVSGFEKLQADPACHSLLKKHLSKEVLDKLKETKTSSFNSSLRDVIQSGVENLDSGIGVYAPDAEAYVVFSLLLDPIIEEYHGGFAPTHNHPAPDFGDTNNFGDLDPDAKYIVSTRIRCGRSVEGFPFNPNMNQTQYQDLEKLAETSFASLPEPLAGTYYPLLGMTDETKNQLIEDHFLFKEGDRFLQAANASRFWPTGRGIFHNKDKKFLVWVGEEDHLRIISMQEGGNVGEVYSRLVQGIQAMEKTLKFSQSARFGWLTFCPTNLGTTIRASVHIKLPLLAASGMEKLQAVADKFQLQVRGSSGEHSEAVGGKYDISNRERLGLTEYEAVEKMYKGVEELIRMEKEAENKDDKKEE